MVDSSFPRTLRLLIGDSKEKHHSAERRFLAYLRSDKENKDNCFMSSALLYVFNCYVIQCLF